MKDLIDIKYWIFDLDNTLYNGQTKVFSEVDKKMSSYISKKLNIIARGFGRSYGASSIQPKGTILTRKLNKILNFDSKKGIIEAQAGISIKEILNFSLKKKMDFTNNSRFKIY